MERNLYVNALLADPVLAVMVQEALQDGLIDRAAAGGYEMRRCRYTGHHTRPSVGGGCTVSKRMNIDECRPIG